MQHRKLHRQKGLTLISWMIVIAFLGFQGIIAINIFPVYLTDSSISTIWKDLSNDSSLVGATPRKISETIAKRLKINNVYVIKKDDIKIKKVKGGHVVSLVYEPRGKIIGSLDFIVTFEHEAMIRSN